MGSVLTPFMPELNWRVSWRKTPPRWSQKCCECGSGIGKEFSSSVKENTGNFPLRKMKKKIALSLHLLRQILSKHPGIMDMLYHLGLEDLGFSPCL